MEAVRIHGFGGPEVMKIEEVERPVPAADELLIRGGALPFRTTLADQKIRHFTVSNASLTQQVV